MAAARLMRPPISGRRIGRWHAVCKIRVHRRLLQSFARAHPRESEVVMPRNFLDNLLDSGSGDPDDQNKGRRRALTLPVSIAVHVVVLIALVVVPLLSMNELPDPVGDS